MLPASSSVGARAAEPPSAFLSLTLRLVWLRAICTSALAAFILVFCTYWALHDQCSYFESLSDLPPLKFYQGAILSLSGLGLPLAHHVTRWVTSYF